MSAKTTPLETNPFPGLRPYREEEEHLFFGRENQVDSMVDKLAGTRFLAVVGTSGSGKSSLVNCGLRPALHQGLMARAGTAWRMAQFRPGNHPIAAMANALAQNGVLFRDRAAAGLSLAEIVETTLRMSKLGLIDIYEQASLDEGVNLLVVVDQFEELFRYRQLEASGRTDAQGISEEAAAFVNLLLEVKQQASCPVFVVLTMRSDFLGDCTQFPGLAEAINEGQYLVPRMTRGERRAAIVGPVGVGGAKIEPALVTRLVNDVGDNPDQLSILQHALNRTWARWQHEDGASGLLGLTHYESIGTMADALDQHAEKAYAELGDTRHRQICEKIFKALTDKATDPRGVRRPTTLGTLCALADATETEITEVIDVFRRPSRSFLMPPAGEAIDPRTVFDISHESLMRVWRRLDTWADEEARSAQVYRRLASTASLHAAGKAGLWRDPDLQLALNWRDRNQPNETWASRYDPGFGAAERFLTESREARDAERAERDAQRRRELEAEREKAEAQARHARRMRWAALFCGALALVAVVGLLMAYRAEQKAVRAQEYAAAGRLASLAVNELDRSLDLALLLSVQASRTATTMETRNSLGATLAHSPRLIRFLHGHTDRVRGVAFSPTDPNVLASAGDDNTIRLWDPMEPDLLGTPLLHDDAVNTVAFNPAGTLLAAAGDERPIRLWDVAKRELVGKLSEHQDVVFRVAFKSPDGTILASASEDGTVRLWDTENRVELRALDWPNRAVVLDVAFSPRGARLAASSRDQTVILWDVASGERQGEPLYGHGDDRPDDAGYDFGFVEGVAFSPTDGTLLVSAGRDRRIRFWNVGVEPPELLGEPLEQDERVLDVAFNPSGTLLASGHYDKTIRLWGVAEREPLGKLLTGHAATVRGVAFSPDGKLLASASDDRKVGLWNVENPGKARSLWQPRSLVGHVGGVASVSFSPTDGSLLASAGYDGTIRLWNVDKGEPLGSPLEGHTDAAVTVAFSPDGRHLASGGNDKTVRLWDVVTAEQIGPPLEHGEAVESVVFSADGERLATASRDRKVRVWEVDAWKLVGEPLELVEADDPWLQGSVKGVVSAAFSPDGALLAAGLNVHGIGDFNSLEPPRDTAGEPYEAIRLWDLTKEPPEVVEPALLGHAESVFSVAFSPDGTLLASASRDRTVVLWDVAGRKPAREPLVGHGNGVYSVVISPDGKRLASASHDETVRLWDVATGQAIGPPLAGHDDVVESVTFSPDGKLLASASFDGTIRVWNIDDASWPERACYIANRNLTLKEWVQYIGKEYSYCRTCPDLPAPEEERNDAPACGGAS